MTAFKGHGTYGNSVGVETPLDFKLNNAAVLVKTTTALGVRPGVFYAGNASLVSGTAGMAYSVAAYQCATQRSASAGAVLGGNDGALSVATTAAPGSNSRIDIIYHWHREYSLDGVDSNPVIGVIQGTAAAVPTAPSLAAFPGAIEIGRATVSAGATATNGGGVVITQTAPFTSVDGGKVAFRSTTEMNLWTTVLTDQRALDLSTMREYRWSGSAWRSFGALAVVVPTSVVGGTIQPGGSVTFTGVATVSLNGCFTTEFDNYEIIYDVTARSAAVDATMRLRAAGADNSAASYSYVRGFDAGTSRTVSSSGTATSSLCDIGGGRSLTKLLVSGAPSAAPTKMIMTATGTSTSAAISLDHGVSSPFDGITFTVPSGTFAGTITVYGYNKAA